MSKELLSRFKTIVWKRLREACLDAVEDFRDEVYGTFACSCCGLIHDTAEPSRPTGSEMIGFWKQLSSDQQTAFFDLLSDEQKGSFLAAMQELVEKREVQKRAN